MILRLSGLTASAACLIGSLSACGSGQPLAGTETGAIAPGQTVSSVIAPDAKKCGGTNGVSVSPCPLVIKKKSEGFTWFNITGAGVATSYLGSYQMSGTCYNKKGAAICTVQNLASPPTYWQANSGPNCGKARPLTFYAYGGSGFIGYGYLTIINKYCP